MPNFPTAGGEIPKNLNPLNLRHYFLLAYWIYFRPTALKCYLYQAEPDLYRTGSGLSVLRRTLFIPAYRNLYLTALGVSALYFVLILIQLLFLGNFQPFKDIPYGAFVLALGLAGGVVRGLYSVARGAARGVTLSVAFALVLSLITITAGSNGLYGSAAIGLGFGLAFSLVGGVAGCMGFDVAFIMLIGVAGASDLNSQGKIAFYLAFFAGASRIVFYLFEVCLALRSICWNKKHPIEWDELIVLPLLGTQRLLAQRLQQDELKGLRLAADIACNPFQRWTVQRTLKTYLENHKAPLYFLYNLLTDPDLNTYVCAPVSKKDWENLPSSGQLLLGELGGQWVNCRTHWADQLAEFFVWSLTWFCRDRHQTPLTRFASMLYQILDENTVSAGNFRLSNYREAYANLNSYRGSEEITRSFEALATFLNYDNIDSLPLAVEMVSGLSPDHTSIRPTVLSAIARLGAIGAEVATYLAATNHNKQKSALVRVAESLDELDRYIVAKVTLPEQQILRQIVPRWHLLLREVSGKKVLNPTFPTYRGKLPQSLNPLNLRHYFLLAYWVYFRPTALNCYLYQAGSGIYQSRGLSKIFRTLGIPAYRSIYCMTLGAIALFSVLLLLISVPDRLFEHNNTVTTVTAIPGGHIGISASFDGTVIQQDLDRKRPFLTSYISSIFGSSSNQPENKRWQEDRIVTAIAVSPDRQYIVSSLADYAPLADYDDWWGIIPYLEKTLKVNILYGSLGFSNKNQTVRTGTLQVWHLKSGKLLHTLQGHTDAVNAVAVTPDGKAISVSDDRTFKVWDINNNKLLHTFKGHTGAVNAVAVTPDGKAISASDDRTLKVWDLNNSKLLYTLKGHGDRVKLVAVTSDGKRAISFAANAATPRLWNLERRVELQPANELLDKLGLGNLEHASRAILLIGGVLSVSLILAVSIIIFGVAGTLFVGLLNFVVLTVAIIPVYNYTFLSIASVLPEILFQAFLSVLAVFFTPLSLAIIAWSLASSVASRKAFGVVGSAILLTGISTISAAIGFFSYAKVMTLPEVNQVVKKLLDINITRFGVTDGSIVGSLVAGIISLVFTGVFSIAVASRLIFHPVYWVPALRSRFGRGKHPVEWDELAVLPLPRTRRTLSMRLQCNEIDGLRLVAEVAGNPFQRAFAQKALHTYLHQHQQVAPLRFLYSLLADPNWQTYIYAPVSKQDWDLFPTTGQVLLGELGGQWVDCSSGWFNRTAERIVWQLTKFLRDRRQTPLTRFATMLYQLLDEKKVEAENFDLSIYRKDYVELTIYSDSKESEEVAQSFEVLADFLAYKHLSDIAKATDAVSKLVPADTAVRPTVLCALADLGAVGKEVANYQAASSRVNKFAALGRAANALDYLDNNIVAEVVTPEKALLRRVIRQWRPLVSEASGRLGRAEILGSVANPYMAGNPVTGQIFVGREDIFRHLETLWQNKEERDSVVLYGHRRMGKTSILRNLPTHLHLTQPIIVVDFNMQGVGRVENTGDLLYSLALILYDSISAVAQEQLEEPDEELFMAHNPYTAFKRFLKQLDGVREGQLFIIAIDEFELIEELIEEKLLDRELLGFWRYLIYTYKWFIIAFAGLHTLKEMTEDYWNPLYTIKTIPVSFLSEAAAKLLIEQPSPDFDIDYAPNAVERIIKLTNGQPYLVQLVGHILVSRFNYQTSDEESERERRFTVVDVETAIDSPEFYQDGNAYFNGVWVQAENSEPAGQIAILKALSHTGLSFTEIAVRTDLDPRQVQAALETLTRHDVVKQEKNGQYVYTVELMRRWVARRIGGQQ